MTKAERELLFTLARIVLSRLGDIEPGDTGDHEAAVLTRSLTALGSPAEEGAADTSEAPQAYGATEAARNYLNKKNGKAAPADDGVMRWANGRPVSAEDQGLG